MEAMMTTVDARTTLKPARIRKKNTESKSEHNPDHNTDHSFEHNFEHNFKEEMTAGDIYDALQEKVATARTRALMGERCVAMELLAQAQADYAIYREVLTGLPLHSLDHALLTTMQILSVDSAPIIKTHTSTTDIIETNIIETNIIEANIIEANIIEASTEVQPNQTLPVEVLPTAKPKARRRAKHAA